MVCFFVDNIHEQKIAFYWKTRLLGESKYWWCSFIFASLKNIFYDTYYRWWVKVQQWMIMVILIYYFYILTHSTNPGKNRMILQWKVIDCRFLYTFHTTTVIKLRKALERWSSFILYKCHYLCCILDFQIFRLPYKWVSFVNFFKKA